MRSEAIVIVGGGPAGISAALECHRQGFDPLVLEKHRLGGLLLNAHRVENYPGFPEGIRGTELVSRFIRQIRRKGIRVEIREVTGLDRDKNGTILHTDGEGMTAQHVIVASGTRARTINDIVTLDEGKPHVHTEVFPLRKIQGKRIGILGAGDAAFDYALNLASRNEVVLLNRSADIRCAPHLRKAASSCESIDCIQEVDLDWPCGFAEGQLQLRGTRAGESFALRADELVLAIGRIPQLDFLAEEQRKKFVEDTDLFLVGDVGNGAFRQTGIAVGEGIMAAMRICHSLKGKR